MECDTSDDGNNSGHTTISDGTPGTTVGGDAGTSRLSGAVPQQSGASDGSGYSGNNSNILLNGQGDWQMAQSQDSKLPGGIGTHAPYSPMLQAILMTLRITRADIVEQPYSDSYSSRYNTPRNRLFLGTKGVSSLGAVVNLAHESHHAWVGQLGLRPAPSAATKQEYLNGLIEEETAADTYAVLVLGDLLRSGMITARQWRDPAFWEAQGLDYRAAALTSKAGIELGNYILQHPSDYNYTGQLWALAKEVARLRVENDGHRELYERAWDANAATR